MALNKVQQDFINSAARPHMETMIKILHDLDTFIADYDALQSGIDSISEVGTVLDDAGDNPRSDAPQLTGSDVKSLYNLSVSMSAVVSSSVKTTLISRMVRSLNIVLKVS